MGRVSGGTIEEAKATQPTSLFLDAHVRRVVADGEVIYNIGDQDLHMFGIVSGGVELRKGNNVVASLGPNDVFGERALIDHVPRNWTAIAVAEPSWLSSTRETSSSWCTNHRRLPWASWVLWPNGCATTTSEGEGQEPTTRRPWPPWRRSTDTDRGIGLATSSAT